MLHVWDPGLAPGPDEDISGATDEIRMRFVVNVSFLVLMTKL